VHISLGGAVGKSRQVKPAGASEVFHALGSVEELAVCVIAAMPQLPEISSVRFVLWQ
jgi:hypothetical protein